MARPAPLTLTRKGKGKNSAIRIKNNTAGKNPGRFKTRNFAVLPPCPQSSR
jgi:hypothetical protein